MFLVMELVSGPDLAQLMRTAGLPTAELVTDIATQGARALDAAHAAGIVHRDVKPAQPAAGPRRHAQDHRLRHRQAQRATRRPVWAVLLGTASYVVAGAGPGAARDPRQRLVLLRLRPPRAPRRYAALHRPDRSTR